jgi:hypothetical protein
MAPNNMNSIFFSGGQFSPATGGQFVSARTDQFKPASSGQFHRRLQVGMIKSFLLLLLKME